MPEHVDAAIELEDAKEHDNDLEFYWDSVAYDDCRPDLSIDKPHVMYPVSIFNSRGISLIGQSGFDYSYHAEIHNPAMQIDAPYRRNSRFNPYGA